MAQSVDTTMKKSYEWWCRWWFGDATKGIEQILILGLRDFVTAVEQWGRGGGVVDDFVLGIYDSMFSRIWGEEQLNNENEEKSYWPRERGRAMGERERVVPNYLYDGGVILFLKNELPFKNRPILMKNPILFITLHIMT